MRERERKREGEGERERERGRERERTNTIQKVQKAILFLSNSIIKQSVMPT